ncbi:MAG TPA: SDR family NAD(P)-dependent oxidoreductase [Candidatus Limnocylindrales bacterium]|jgi:short chain dehydrogenase
MPIAPVLMSVTCPGTRLSASTTFGGTCEHRRPADAGIIRDNLILKMPLEDWDAVMNVHLRGAFLMTKAVQAHMTAAKYGQIIYVAGAPKD